MKNLGYIATVALMASGMALAQSSGSQGTMDSQIGSSTASAPHTEASPKPDTPGAMGAPTTPDESAAQGETPATGVQSSPQQGSPVENSARPDMNTGAAPTADNSADAATKGSDPNSANTPSYAKPITSSEGSDTSSTPSQKSTDTGTASPK